MRANSNFQKFGLILGSVFALALGAKAGGGDSERTLRVLETLDGRVFDDVAIDSVDPNGLLFRHRDGIAKIRFANLNPAIREAYGFTEEDALAFETGRTITEIVAAPNSAPPQACQAAGVSPLVLSFRIRTTFPTASPACANYGFGPMGCGASLAQFPWASHWNRFHPGLAYSRFPCRQLAERDFLLSSGILTRPPGVWSWRLR